MQFDLELTCRIAVGAMILTAAAIGLPHRVRADKAGGHVPTRVDPRWFWATMACIGPPVLFVIVAFLIQPRWIDFARLPLPAWVRLLGIPLGLAGVTLFTWMFRHLGLNVTSTSMPREKATLVTSGPYRWIRHPMYSAALILVAAFALLTSNAVALLGGLVMFALLAARSRIEEQRLVEKFGDDYRNYQQCTGRFLPSLTRRLRR